MRPGSVYSMHPGYAMEEAAERNIFERTGTSIEGWVEIVRTEGPENEKEQANWLKTVHGITTNYAMWIVERAAGRGADTYDADAHVEEMFAGAKAPLRPLYDRLLAMGFALGGDIKVCPGKTAVPIYRKHVIAQIKPTTRTRIDFGLALKDAPITGRLVDTGGYEKKDRITRRIEIGSLDDIDDEVERWLKRAYELDT